MTNTFLATSLGQGIKNIKFIIGYNDPLLIALGAVTSGQINLQYLGNNWNLPANCKIIGIEVKTTTAFTGSGSLSGLTASVGISGSVAFFTATYDCFAAVADTPQETALFKAGTRAAVPVLVNWIATGGTGKLNGLTAGVLEITIYFLNVTTP